MQLNKQNIINQLLRGTNEQITAKDLAIITHCIYNPDQKLYSVASKESRDKLSSKFPSFDIVSSIYNEMKSTPFFKNTNNRFTFIDLFSGIGGFRIALQNLGGKCIYSSEWDKFAQRTYFTNFGEVPFGDITLEETKQFIPDNFDVLCAGFPCQAFSLAGKKKGFEETRGTLFFDVAEIIKRKRPKAFFL